MPENPLLPNARLKQLYATMVRARSAAGSTAGMEAITATVAEQLEPGDAVIASGPETGLKELLQPVRGKATRVPSVSVLTPATSPLAFAAGVAAAARFTGDSRLVAVLLDTRRPEHAWVSVLDQIQRDRLPLIVICPQRTANAGSVFKRPDDGPLTWQALSRAVKKLQLPVLTVDGADAVAMYRAMQESVLRTRHGDGPAVLWCLMPERGKRQPGSPPIMAPLGRLAAYLATRRIPLPRTVATRTNP